MAVLLGAELGPARTQGPRGTCLAFATTAAHCCTLGRSDDLSVEWLYCCAKRRDANPFDSVGTEAIRGALREDGQAHEQAFPYDPMRSHRDPAYVVPVDPRITVYRRASNGLGVSLTDITNSLDAGWTPILGIGTTRPFHAATATGGIVLDPPAGSSLQSLHAVLAVGWGTTSDGTRCVIIRNSWGPGWGVKGYALLSESYINSQLLEVFRPD